MSIQEINHSISTLRTICVQHELPKYISVLDSIVSYMESQNSIISIVGARTSGKSAVVNGLAGADILPSQIFKPHIFYKISHGKSAPRLRLTTGEEGTLRSFDDISRYSKQDYDSIVIAQCHTGLFNAPNIEVRSGFETGEKCPLVNCHLSDIIIYCVKATALFSIDDVSFLEDLVSKKYRNAIICVTHINNISQKSVPEIVKFISSKHIEYPIVYFSDEPIDEIHELIKNQYGSEYLGQVLTQCLEERTGLEVRMSVVQSAINEVIDTIAQDLSDKKNKLEEVKDRKYSTYLSKLSQLEAMRLGWTDILTEYNKRETKCVELILAELNKAKSKIELRLLPSITTISSPKEWWENIFPSTMKNEIDNLSSGIDNLIQPNLIRDFNWLNHELQSRFHQTPITDNQPIGDTHLDFTIDSDSLSISNLRTARYLSRLGGAAMATTLFFVVGPVGGLASAACSILGDRYIHNTIQEQKESLKVAVSNVIDEVFTKMASMIPSRVNGLYEELAKEIATKEEAWTKSNEKQEFACDEIDAINKLTQSIHDVNCMKI